MFISDIVKITGGRFQGKSREAEIIYLLIDSRSVFSGDGTLFIAIKGERHDGHRYVEQLYQKGIRNFLLSSPPKDPERMPEANIILVEDTLRGLQQLAAAHRSQCTAPVIGITGSNGKTIVKEWLWQLLGKDKNIVRSPRSFNSQVGVPLSVWLLNKEHEMGIFEAGISQPGEMERLEPIIRPDIGIITNVREAHIENFTDRRALAAEKLKLFTHSQVLIYCSDHQEIDQLLSEDPAYGKLKKISWSVKGRAGLEVSSIREEQHGSSISAIYEGRPLELYIPFRDEASVENSIHCWLVLLYLGYDQEVINERMRGLSAIAMRLEVKEGINNCILVNDSYNTDLASLNIALDFLNQQKPENRKTLILSDIYQSGKDNSQLYGAVAELVAIKKIDRLIGIGEGMTAAATLFNMEKSFYRDTEEFLKKFQESDFHNESILLKGARNFAFEMISERLQQKAHETVLEVNLNALVGNYNYFKSLLPSHVKLMVMVKAASYGAGSIEVASALQHNRVDYLGVAYADEGIHLREGGISLPIMVMNPQVSAFDAMIRHQLQPELYNFRTLRLFSEALRSNNYYSLNNEPFPIHLKLDTGMHRLGFDEADLEDLTGFLQENKSRMTVRTIFSHLSASDDAEKDEYSLRQIAQFRSMSEKIIEALGYPVDRHMLNSNGILRFPEARFEMVRLGIGLYGLVKDPEHQRRLRPVSRLRTVVSQLRKVKKGARVGYDQRYVMQADGMIATIPIGYADGLNRKLGNGRWKVRINGSSAPIVGNVCMDMCMVDVSGITVEEGDAVTIFESQEDLRQMAALLETIPYELLSGISGRVKRVFYEE